MSLQGSPAASASRTVRLPSSPITWLSAQTSAGTRPICPVSRSHSSASRTSGGGPDGTDGADAQGRHHIVIVVLVADPAQHRGKGHPERTADRVEQFAGRFLLAAFDLGQVAEADP